MRDFMLHIRELKQENVRITDRLLEISDLKKTEAYTK